MGDQLSQLPRCPRQHELVIGNADAVSGLELEQELQGCDGAEACLVDVSILIHRRNLANSGDDRDDVLVWLGYDVLTSCAAGESGVGWRLETRRAGFPATTVLAGTLVMTTAPFETML